MAAAAKKKRKVKQGSGNFLSAIDAVNVLRQSPSCAPTLRSVLRILLAGGPTAESFAEDLFANGFLHLVPSILGQSSRKGVTAGIEVLGALSVSSLFAHRKVVSDKNAIRALAEILKTRPNVELHTVACHAVVDLLITPIGCEALKESGVIIHLLHLLCWVGDLSKEAQKCLVDEDNHPSKSLAADETDSNCREAQSEPLSCDFQSERYDKTRIAPSALNETAFCEEVEELVTTASRAISALIRNLGIENSSPDLCREGLHFLRRFWHTLLRKDQILLKSTAADDEPTWTCNRGTRRLVAKCVVQLAMELDSTCSRKLSVQQGLFENTDFNQTLFFEKYWEQTPIVVSRKLPSCLSALSKTFTTLAAVVNNVLAWFVGCPPATADQLDSLRLLESIESSLGEPMIYGQDIRIVKTVLLEPDAVSPLKQVSERTVELHYSGNGGPTEDQVARYVHPREILEALDKGYTVAMKGMELRCSSIADIADCLARQCGQPSVGANLYITPANAQGLDLHYDDHCVFVCQLVGRKTWNIYPPHQFLPRLYSCRTLNRGALNNSTSTVYKLDEGDVLYIPRGFPHKAHCEQSDGGFGTSLPGSRDDKSDDVRQDSEENLNNVGHFQNLGDSIAKENPGSSGFGPDQYSRKLKSFLPGLYSLHLTFGVEVEPPFEWEGLVHIALRLWAEQRWQMEASCRRSKESCNRYERLCEGLLHIAINLLGEKAVEFRKACTIAAEPSRPKHCSSHCREQDVASHEAGSKVFVCEQDDSLVCNICDPISLDYFHKLLEVVVKKANFKEALALAQDASGEYLGSCSGGMEWLRHVPQSDGHSATSTAEPVVFVMSEIHSDQFKQVNMSEVENTFSYLMAEFGKTLLYHQASNAFGSIHRQYRTIRKKFNSGMLALHENSSV